MKITLPANYAINHKWVTTLKNGNEKKIATYIINQISENEINLKYEEEEITLTKIDNKQKKEIKNLLVKCFINGTIAIDKKSEIIKHYESTSQTTWYLQIQKGKNKNDLTDSVTLTINDTTKITVKKSRPSQEIEKIDSLTKGLAYLINELNNSTETAFDLDKKKVLRNNNTNQLFHFH